MRRILITTVLLAGLAGLAFAVIHSPLLRYHMPLWNEREAGPLPADSMRQLKYYTAVLRAPVDSICVVKHLRELYVFHQDTLLKIYRVALGDAPEGHKHFEGDERTPEGRYFVDGKNPFSSCHKNLGISYPNAADRAYAKRTGKPAGGDIKIHGLPNGQGAVGAAHIANDWTNGCVAVTDEEIDELYAHVRVGVPVFIAP